jgi:hypothetical protein
MKNLSAQTKVKNLTKWMLFSAISMSIMVACKKNNDSAPEAQAVPTMNCAVGQVAPAGYNCIYNNGNLFAGAGNLINNVQFSYSSIGLEGVVSLTATSANSYVDFNDPMVPAKYSGAFSAQGTVKFGSDIYCNGIPLAGDYVLSGTEGMYSWGVLSGFVWNLTGPTNMQLRSAGSSVLVGDINGLSRDGNNRVGLSVTVHVNGQYCGYIYTR